MGLKMHHNKEIYTAAEIESDLEALYEYCIQQKFSQEEMEKIWKPLIDTIEKQKLLRKLRNTVIFLGILALLYTLTYFETVQWHLSAIGRIAMIQMLPIWDWRHLKYEKCLLYRDMPTYKNVEPISCTFCESIEKIPIEYSLDGDIIAEKYINLDVPVVLPDSLDNWSIFNAQNLSKLSEEFNDSVFLESRPCKVSSNILNKEEFVDEILQKGEFFDSYFYHFQNCDFQAMKHFRLFAPRPKFVPQELYPIQYSWLLVNKNYNVNKFKKVHLNDKIGIVGQVLGSNIYRLSTVSDCENECPILEIALKPGEAILFTSLWNLEYVPVPDSENLAIVLETHEIYERNFPK